MSERTLTTVFRAVGAIGGVLALAGTAVLVALGYGEEWWTSFSWFIVMFSIFFAVFVWLVIPRQPRNGVVWAMAVSALFGGLSIASQAGAAAVAAGDPDLLFDATVIPADLPTSAAAILMVNEPAAIIAIYIWITFGLLLFPDGKLPSRRWRWVAWLTVIILGLMAVASAERYRPGLRVAPVESEEPVVILLFALTAAVILSLAALIVRFRRSRGPTREQFKWIVWGAAIFVPVIVATSMVGETQYEDLFVVPLALATAVFLGSYGIAVARYRLFDIDVVISKTVTYGALAVFITVLYVVIVVGIGTAVGQGDEPNLALAIGATAAVALLFEPLRSRLQRWANRLVYGKRATPYAVLAELTARLSEADSNERALQRVAELLASGTGSEEAVVWLRVGDRLRPEAFTASEPPEAIPLDDGAMPERSGDAAEPIEHGGELLGALSIAKSQADPVTPADRQLLQDVAAGASLLLRNIALNAELGERAVELRESRRRLIAAQDLERRKLERNLHDGAQQQVVALKVKLGLAKTLADREGIDELAIALGNLADDTQRAVDGMRAAARGIYPPLLASEGIRAALVSARRDSGRSIDIETDRLGRYAAEIEATVYFSVLEAIGGTTSTSQARVRLSADGDELVFSVSNMGALTDAGYTAITDRMEAVGGTLSVESARDGGLVIRGRVPAQALEPA